MHVKGGGGEKHAITTSLDHEEILTPAVLLIINKGLLFIYLLIIQLLDHPPLKHRALGRRTTQ